MIHIDEHDHEGIAHQGGEGSHEHHGKGEQMGLCVVKESQKNEIYSCGVTCIFHGSCYSWKTMNDQEMRTA